MKGKAEQTTAYIIEKVAPIFNKKGYYGTSMSAITEATGLTKGAVYGNFKNKEDLAFAAFQYNVNLVVDQIKTALAEIDSPLLQLKALIDFYRKYLKNTSAIGGCPIINIGVDANHQNSELLNKVKEVIKKLQYYIERMIVEGQKAGEIKKNCEAKNYAKQIFASIEGAVFMTTIMDDDTYIEEMMRYLNQIIDNELAA